MPDNATNSSIWVRSARFVYLLLPLAIYPTILILAGGPPYLTHLTLDGYLGPTVESQILLQILVGFIFILVFFSIYSYVFDSSFKMKLTILTMSSSTLLYAVVLCFSRYSYPLSLFPKLAACSGLFPCYPMLMHGYFMWFSVLAALYFAKAVRRLPFEPRGGQ